MLCLGGCGRWDETLDGDLRVLRKEKRSDSAGYASFEFQIEEGETQFIVTGIPEEGYEAYVDVVYGPMGELLFYSADYWDSPRMRTNAIYASMAPVLNMPTLPNDDALLPGGYEVVFGVVNSEANYQKGVDIRAAVTIKADPDLAGGELLVNLVYAGGVDQDVSLMGGMETVISKWQELYAQTGIDVVIEESIWEEGDLDAPSIGSRDDYLRISEEAPLRAVNVVIVPEISLWDGLYGIAGHIPGSLVAAPNAAVLASASMALGTNGTFDAGEKRLFAETLAHETGHYLGLYHPVEIGWEEWDALEDTVQCTSESSCLEAMMTNLMFAFPYCTSSGCTPQNDLTLLQGEAMNLYVGVD
jgi:hypothetical protein